MIIITGYQGGMYDGEIARVYNRCMLIRGFIAERTVSPEEIRRLWFEYSTFNPRDYAMVVDGGRVYGIAFTGAGPGFGRIWLCIDPMLPRYYLRRTILYLLSWARHRLSMERISVVKVNCGYEHSILYGILREILGMGIEYTMVTLMEYSGKAGKYKSGSDIVVRKGSVNDIPGVVGVWNNAFRRYSWFEEWSVDDAVKWYSTRNLILYVAIDRETGEIIGFIDAEERRGFDGRLYGYIYTLGVHPKKQCRGVGGALLKAMVNELLDRGAERIYLDAIHGLENYYAKHGFSIIRRSIMLAVETARLPAEIYPIIALE